MTQTIQTELPPIKVGDVLYRNQGEIIEVTVCRIGRTYLYLVEHGKIDVEHPIDKISLRHTNKTWPQRSFQLYRTKQEIADKRELFQLREAFRKHFEWNRRDRNTLDQLREAARVLGIDVGETT